MNKADCRNVRISRRYDSMVSKVKSLSCIQLLDSSLTSLLHLWDFPGKNTGVGCHCLLQEIFPTQGLNPGLLHCRQMLYGLSHLGGPGPPMRSFRLGSQDGRGGFFMDSRTSRHNTLTYHCITKAEPACGEGVVGCKTQAHVFLAL